MKWGLCFQVTPEKLYILEYLNVCLHFFVWCMAFSDMQTLTKNMTMKRSNDTYTPIHLSISASFQVLSNHAATQPCQDKPLLELAFQPAVNVGTGKNCIHIFWGYKKLHTHFYVNSMHSTGKEKVYSGSVVGPRKDEKKHWPTRRSNIYPTATCPDWKNERWKEQG